MGTERDDMVLRVGAIRSQAGLITNPGQRLYDDDLRRAVEFLDREGWKPIPNSQFKALLQHLNMVFMFKHVMGPEFAHFFRHA